eukprot:7431814-Pyramimonas_sp.AAC.1
MYARREKHLGLVGRERRARHDPSSRVTGLVHHPVQQQETGPLVGRDGKHQQGCKVATELARSNQQ